MDVLELLDGQKLEVVSIFGGSRLINGVTRDTLSIEVDPSIITLDELKSIFKNPNKTNHLYMYMTEDDDSPETKVEIGEGYNIYVSGRKETRKVFKEPGPVRKDEYYDIFVINIAQLTYDEYQDFKAGIWTPPDMED